MIKRSLKYLSAVFVLLTGCAEEKPQSPAIVTVGERVFTLDDLRLAVPGAAGDSISTADLESLINRWINSQVLYQNGLQLGLGENPEIKRRVKEFEAKIIGAAYVDSVLSAQINVTDDEIQRYYEANQEIFAREEEEIHIKHMIFPDLKSANSARLELIRQKADFDTLAHKYNPDSLKHLSDVGFITQNQILKVLWDKIKITRDGNTTRPVKTDFGYHLIRVVERKKEGTIKALKEVEMEIHARLRQDKWEEQYLALLNQLKNKTEIQTNLDLLGSLPPDSLRPPKTQNFVLSQ